MANTNTLPVIGTVSDPRPVPASGPGALPGWEASCDSCSLVIRASLRSIVQTDGIAHSRYHRRQRGWR